VAATSALALLLLSLATAAFANTYRPNRLGDHTPNGCTRSDCTLREAITKTNNNAGPDLILLRGGKTYNLAQPNTSGDDDLNATGDLDVLGALRIKSSNKKPATVNANGIDRVFEVGPSTSVNATFNRIVIRGGQSEIGGHGGGIDSEFGGVLKLIRSKVVGNAAAAEGGGIAADGGTLKVVRSVIGHNSATNAFQNAGGIEGEPGATENEVISISRSRIVDNHAGSAGGGIYAYNRLTINRSTLRGNTSGEGGAAIYNGFGTAVIRNSTLSGNLASGDGGGMENLATATFVNDTLAGNQASEGGGINSDGTLTNLNAVTIARNSTTLDTGGGINQNSGVINVKNSLIALNTDPVGPDCHVATPGGIVSAGHNLIGDTTDCTGIFDGTTHDITNVNPKIAQLADNGGPTKTIALRAGSPAINHAGNSAPPRDQRGVKRDSRPDIGAFERR